MKQSSIEWAVSSLDKLIPSGNDLVIGAILLQAKAMHKEEHRKTFNQGLMSNFQNFEDYYHETFNT